MNARLLVAKNITRLRRAKGMSQTQLVALIDPAKLHIGQSYLSKLENGQKNVSIDTLQVIADALDARVIDLLADN